MHRVEEASKGPAQVLPAAFSWCGGEWNPGRARVAAEHTCSEEAGMGQGEHRLGCHVGRSRRETREERAAAGETRTQAAGTSGEEGGEWVRPHSEQSIAKGPGEASPVMGAPCRLPSSPGLPGSKELFIPPPSHSQNHHSTLSASGQSSLPAGSSRWKRQDPHAQSSDLTGRLCTKPHLLQKQPTRENVE